MQEQSLKKRYLAKLISSITNLLLNIIVVAIVPRSLGPVAYGSFAYLQNFFSQMIGFLDFGTSLAFFTKLSANNSRKELISFYVLYILLVFFFCILFLFCIDWLDLNSFFMPKIPVEYIYYGFFLGFLSWLTQIFIKISDAYALTVSAELIKTIHKILMLFLLLFFIYNLYFDLMLYFYYNYISFVSFMIVVTVLFCKYKIFSRISFKVDFKKLAKEFIVFCHPLVLYTIVLSFVSFFDIWLLQKVSGSIESGFYGLSYSLVGATFIFTSSMTPIIIREFAKNYTDKNLKKIQELFIKYVPVLYSIAAFFGVFLSFQSVNVLQIFTDDKFKDAAFVLSIMSFYPIHQTYGQICGGFYYASEQTKLHRNIALSFVPLHLFLSFIFIYTFNLGASGLALKMVILQIMITNTMLYFNSKQLDFSILFFVKHQIYSILFFVFCGYISSFFVFFNSAMLNLVICGLFYICFAIIGITVFPTIIGLEKGSFGYLFNLYKFKK